MLRTLNVGPSGKKQRSLRQMPPSRVRLLLLGRAMQARLPCSQVMSWLMFCQGGITLLSLRCLPLLALLPFPWPL